MAESTFRLRRMAHLVLALGWSDFRLKYRGSVLGYLWSFAGPLAQFAVIYFVFRPFVGQAIDDYHVYLFLGIIVWEYFALLTSACVSLPVDKQSFIEKIRFPRLLLALSTGWTHVLIFATRFAIFAVVSWMLDAWPGWDAFYAPVLVLQMSLLGLGVGMLLASYSLRYRDIPHLWAVVLQILFWLTPVMYPLGTRLPIVDELRQVIVGLGSWTLGDVVHAFVRLQPLSLVLDDARRVLLDGHGAPPTLLHVLAVTGICAALFMAGAVVYRIRSASFIEEY